MGIITYNKSILKNGHQTDAIWINRSRSGTRKLVKSKRCFPEVQGRRRFRWIQLKNSFIVAAYMIGKLFPHGMPYRYNLKKVPTQMPVRHRLKYRDVGIRLPVMFCQDCSKHKIQVVFQGHQAISHRRLEIVGRIGTTQYLFRQRLLQMPLVQVRNKQEIIKYVPLRYNISHLWNIVPYV